MALRAGLDDETRASLIEGRKLVALREQGGSEWVEEHRVKTYRQMFRSDDKCPYGSLAFFAVEGGYRVIGVHEIVELL